MGKAVVFLASPGAGLDVVETADILSPGRLTSLAQVRISRGNMKRVTKGACHLVEFAVLYHHRVDDTQEALVRGE